MKSVLINCSPAQGKCTRKNQAADEPAVVKTYRAWCQNKKSKINYTRLIPIVRACAVYGERPTDQQILDEVKKRFPGYRPEYQQLQVIRLTSKTHGFYGVEMKPETPPTAVTFPPEPMGVDYGADVRDFLAVLEEKYGKEEVIRLQMEAYRRRFAPPYFKGTPDGNVPYIRIDAIFDGKAWLCRGAEVTYSNTGTGLTPLSKGSDWLCLSHDKICITMDQHTLRNLLNK